MDIEDDDDFYTTCSESEFHDYDGNNASYSFPPISSSKKKSLSVRIASPSSYEQIASKETGSDYQTSSVSQSMLLSSRTSPSFKDKDRHSHSKSLLADDEWKESQKEYSTKCSSYMNSRPSHLAPSSYLESSSTSQGSKIYNSNLFDLCTQTLHTDQKPVSDSNSRSRKSSRHGSNHERQHKKIGILVIYRQFLCENRFALKLIEDFFSRMVMLYAPFSRIEEGYDSNHDATSMVKGKVGNDECIQAETWFAILNLWGFFNDCLFYYGDADTNEWISVVGNGLTINDDIAASKCSIIKRFCTPEKKKLIDNSNDALQNEIKEKTSHTNWIRKTDKSASAIILLRAILSIVDCVAPAIEVTTHYSALLAGRGRSGDNTCSTNCYARRSQMVTYFERIKFLCRAGVLTINFWSFWKSRICSKSNYDTLLKVEQPILKEELRINRNRGSKTRSNDDEKIASSIAISGIGILQDGGLLRPDGSILSTQSREERRVRRLLYIGKRTGRKVKSSRGNLKRQEYNMTHTNYNRAATDTSCTSGSMLCSSSHTRKNSKSDMIKNWINRIRIKMTDLFLFQQNFMATTAKKRFGYLLLGEILHLYRPLYWAQACHNHDTRVSIYPYLSDDRISKENRSNKAKNMTMIRSWIICLAMDIISHNLTCIGTRVSTEGEYSRRNGSNYTGVNDDISIVDISSQQNKEELHRRKLMWVLYALRMPVWCSVTHPLVNKACNLLRFWLPLLGKPLAAYVMDSLIYWQKWHFMLER